MGGAHAAAVEYQTVRLHGAELQGDGSCACGIPGRHHLNIQEHRLARHHARSREMDGVQPEERLRNRLLKVDM